MSYDITIYVGMAHHEIWSRNMTSNIGPMYDKASGKTWYTSSLYEQSDVPCPVVFEMATTIVAAMKADPAGYKALNPANGWGNYELALDFMEDLARNCERNPDGFVNMWR